MSKSVDTRYMGQIDLFEFLNLEIPSVYMHALKRKMLLLVTKYFKHKLATEFSKLKIVKLSKDFWPQIKQNSMGLLNIFRHLHRKKDLVFFFKSEILNKKYLDLGILSSPIFVESLKSSSRSSIQWLDNL